jgi:small conductance mechanosensitive channel
MTLRVTQIRDMEGKAHYLPNGTISQVVVLSKDYARALVDVEINNDQDVDHVMGLLKSLGEELMKDRPDAVLEPTEVRGVETMNATGCTIRTLTKTGPGLQWEIAREYRRRVLLRFKQEGIAMPLPQRVVWTKEGHPLRETGKD